eukprot:CAMPEP_0181120242 /NCGR_PEP_ID=MMETSP1071-20121207/24049_1 /TAXON_ID=35127 /ORGANISM="Thalassiosira sp., Strain NH16" /LENGTH=472 /DNA_ID=CAMNT_0023204879 /DNA_START=294 /DNA_END=1712 /DNA_ORIENTATION=+
MPIRHSSSSSSTITEQLASMLPPTPEVVANATLWGATGILLTNFHTHLHLPYWACISLTNVCVRSAMFPIVVRGAKTSVRFGKISPEVQYVISNLTSGMKELSFREKLSQAGSAVWMQSMMGKDHLLKISYRTMRGLFEINKVNVLDLFKSPALQIPCFWYFAADMRKLIEGSDPALAQQLVDSSFFWITDLTESDPWYVLPMATGALLYLNVEMAVGKKALSGKTSSKSNMAKMLKDAFQSLAIFMPCFMAQQSAGVQIYLATSMVFTLVQSAAMRNDAFRQALDLPPMNAKAKGMREGEHVKDFLEKMAERQAAKARGGFVLGEGVHVTGAQISVPRFGERRKSSIVVVEKEVETGAEWDESLHKAVKIEFEVPDYTLKSLLVFPDMYKTSTPMPYLPGMAEPVYRAQQQHGPAIPDIPDNVMDAANRGEKLDEPIKMAPKEVIKSKRQNSGPINVSKLKAKWNRKKKGK